MQQLNQFYLSQPEPNQSIMLSLRQIILNFDKQMSEHWKWKLPFFYYKNKPFCYIWKDGKTQRPYIGFVKSDLIKYPDLIQGNRKKMKVLYIDTNSDIPFNKIVDIFNLLKPLYD